MNQENIQVGDLVIVVKPTPCCGYFGDVGKIFTVLDIEGPKGTYSECWQCGKVVDECDAQEKDDYWHDLKTLKRIPPLSELESIKVNEEIPA